MDLHFVLLKHYEEGVAICLHLPEEIGSPEMNLPPTTPSPAPHLVHEHKGPLMAVVDIFIGRVRHTAMLHLCPACLQIAVPEFVAKEQERQM